MKPVDQFLKSVREGFSKNQATDWTQIALLLVAALALVVGLTVWLGRGRKRRDIGRRIDAIVTTTGLKRSDLDYLAQLAAAVGHPLLDVLTGLGHFEQATAAALASQPPTYKPLDVSVFGRVRGLRKTLGFSPLPTHHWLLSTRELVEGDAVALLGVPHRVAEVNEGSFAVDLPARTAPMAGATAGVVIVRADDSRYMSRTRVLATEMTPVAVVAATGGPPLQRVFFAHDEHPERQQSREHVRVRVHGPVSVRLMDAPAVDGVLADVSAGGLSLNLPLSSDGPIPRGARLRCTFTLEDGGDAFEMVAAVVSDAGTGLGPRLQHIRASFTGLAPADRDRLAAAVARLQRRPPADGTDPAPP